MCHHTSQRPPYSASSPAGSSETSHPDSWWNCGFAQPNNFCTNCQKMFQGSTSACLSPLPWSWPNCSGQMLTFIGPWHAGEVCSSRMNPGFSCIGKMADVWCGVCERFADVNIVNRVPHGEAGGLWYGQAYATDNAHKCILSTAI
jgi:hypothetical protein